MPERCDWCVRESDSKQKGVRACNALTDGRTDQDLYGGSRYTERTQGQGAGDQSRRVHECTIPGQHGIYLRTRYPAPAHSSRESECREARATAAPPPPFNPVSISPAHSARSSLMSGFEPLETVGNVCRRRRATEAPGNRYPCPRANSRLCHYDPNSCVVDWPIRSPNPPVT